MEFINMRTITPHSETSYCCSGRRADKVNGIPFDDASGQRLALAAERGRPHLCRLRGTRLAPIRARPGAAGALRVS